MVGLILNAVIPTLINPAASKEDRKRALRWMDRLPGAPVAYLVDQAVPMKTSKPIGLKNNHQAVDKSMSYRLVTVIEGRVLLSNG